MIPAKPDIVASLTEVQTELRKIPVPKTDIASLKLPPEFENLLSNLLVGATNLLAGGKALGCRLLHWNPELGTAHRGVYRPLDTRVGGRAHAFFAKVYKTKYRRPDQARSSPDIPERQFGVSYSGYESKREVTPLLDAFKRCASQAGELVAAAKEQLTAVLPVETLTAKDHIHRWLFTVYDVAWKNPPESALTATRYIPMQGFNAFMQTDESVLYDLDHIRSTPWSEIVRRFDKNNWGRMRMHEGPYASWNEKLPEYYASRIDDIVTASDLTIDWLVMQLENQ